MSGDKKDIWELIEEMRKMGKWMITDITVDLRQTDVDFCATPDGEDYELTVAYTAADRPRKQDNDIKQHDNRICFLISAEQFDLLLKESRKGLERR